MVLMVNNAKTSIFYSAFVCQLDHPLPGQGNITMRYLFSAAAARGVRVNLFMNPSMQYGNKDPGSLPIGVEIRYPTGSGIIPAPFHLAFGKRFSNHHQKFLCVDNTQVLLGGVEVHPCRAGWMQLNGEPTPYFWHEIGVLLSVDVDFAQWVHQQWNGVFVPPPLPFLQGDVENSMMCCLINNAVDCVHMEAQLCISTKSTYNGVFRTLADRLVRSYTNHDTFRFFLLVNMTQPDEHPVVSTSVSGMLTWTLGSLYRMVVVEAGVPDVFFDARVVVAKLEHLDVHVKIHSNLLIADARAMIRSSSNLTDRSLSDLPCDNELGVFVSGPAVAVLQQQLWSQYLGVTEIQTPESAFKYFCNNSGVVRRIDSATFCDSLKHDVLNTLFSLYHKLPAFGGSQHIVWKNENVY